MVSLFHFAYEPQTVVKGVLLQLCGIDIVSAGVSICWAVCGGMEKLTSRLLVEDAIECGQ